MKTKRNCSKKCFPIPTWNAVQVTTQKYW
jgi:hypothetical protein